MMTEQTYDHNADLGLQIINANTEYADTELPPLTGGEIMGALTKGAISLVPIVGGVTIEFINLIENRKKQREFSLLKDMAENIGLDLEDLKRKIVTDKELENLIINVVDAASNNVYTEKLKVFSKILNVGVTAGHNERVLLNAIVRQINKCEPEHIEIIEMIESAKDDNPMAHGGATSEFIVNKLLNFPEGIAKMIVVELVQFGIIENILEGKWDGAGGLHSYKLTRLGVDLLMYLREIDD